jgi:UDP-3-O-[3-hydroxymyristoyl] glucosamine N-acyltransferase
MEYTTRQIADLLNGSLVGNPHEKIHSLSKIEEGESGSLSFLSNPKYESFLYSTRASAVLVSHSFEPSKPVKAILIKVQDAYTAFSILLEKFNQGNPSGKKGMEQPCFVDPSALLGEDTYIGAFAYIGAGSHLGKGVKVYPQVYIGDGVVLGDYSILYPGVKVYSNTQIGKGVIIHSGSVIGGDGFGFAPQADGTFSKIPQTGNVVIEDYVEIGANTCIDRATIGSTLIQKGVKLDNLIQIGHNVDLGKNTVIAAQTGISGSTKVGENCLMGGQTGIAGHLNIGKGNQFGARTGIHKSIREEGKQFRGHPILSYKDSLKLDVWLRNFYKVELRIRALEQNQGLNSGEKPENET